MKNALALLALLQTHALAAPALKTGTYALAGVNPGGGSKYDGRVTIAPSGGVYKLTWMIANRQAQSGVAILEGNVLSVGYLDASGRDLGVVSYKVVKEDRLEGRWAGLGSRQFGLETLVWLNADLPVADNAPDKF